jgi:hypothetical protein
MGKKNFDDFEKADMEHGIIPAPAPAGLIITPTSGEDGENLPAAPKNMLEVRDNLVKEYHKGSSSLAEKLESEGKNNLEGLIMSLVDEVIKETDSLLANELVSISQGDLRDASIISYKRSEVLEKAIKAVQAKQVFEKENGVDVNSPSMLVVFKYFMGKVKDVFGEMNTDDELSDTFFRNLASNLSEWKKELDSELNDLDKLDG